MQTQTVSSTIAHPDHVCRAAVERHGDVIEGMVEAMLEQADAGCTEETLRSRGYTQAEVEQLGPVAAQMAKARFVRPLDESPECRKARRVREGAKAVLALMPTTDVAVTHLMHRDFSKTELDDILPSIFAEAADLFAGEVRA